jgi:DNA topoisomerase I
VLGVDPETGLDVTLRTGRFGPYVQLGEAGREAEALSLPKGMTPTTSTSRRRCAAGAAARGRLHPETGKPITAGIGRYGPFVQHDGTYANLDNFEDVFTVGLNRAVARLHRRASRRGRASARSPATSASRAPTASR